MKRTPTPVALVTGSGKRLGRQIAIGLAREGYDLILHHFESTDGVRETQDRIRAMGRRAIVAKADLRSFKAIRGMMRKAVASMGRLDLLVNNAAIFVDASLSTTTEKMWDNVVGLNLKAMFFCCQQAAPIMLKQKRGCIINIASLGGLQAWTGHAPYSISKAGVLMLTRLVAKQLAPVVTVNAIAPGVIDMGDEEYEGQTHIPRSRIPLGRYGHPRDVISLVIYLSKEAQYVTGQTFTVDGGQSI